MVLVSHNFNLQRIIDVINSNPNILRQNNTDGLLRLVQIGNPAQMVQQKPERDGMPYCYVTTASNLQETSPQTGVSIPDNVKSVTVEYSIVIVSNMDGMLDTESVKGAGGGKQVTAEKKLYNLLTLMRALIEANPTFKNPDSDDDPIFVRSIISNVQWEEKTKGTTIQIVTMTLLATIGTLFFLEIPGIADPIPLISKPVDRDTDTVEDILDDTLILKDTAVIKSKRTITAEFESTSEITSTLRTIKNDRESDSFTITSPTGDEVITAYVTQLASSTGFSDMETSIIQLDVVNP